MKYLITGGAGFIGSNLSLELIKKGNSVTVLDNLNSQIHGDDYEKSPSYQSIKGKVDFIKGDVRNKSDWIKSLNEVDIIIHLAAETGTGQSMYCVQKYIDVNVVGLSILYDILVSGSHSIKKLVLASSRAVYGEGKYICEKCNVVYPLQREEKKMKEGYFDVQCPRCNGSVQPIPTDESSELHPSSTYGMSKKMQEEMMIAMGRSLKIPVVVFRYQNVYGPGQSLNNPYTGILSIFSNRIRNGKIIEVYEDGNESRDFVFIDDVVEATIVGMGNNNKYIIYNVGSGSAIKIFSIAKMLVENFNSTTEIKITGNFRIGDIRHNQADITKLIQEFNYNPKFDFQTGIRNFIDWANKQKIEKDRYQASIEELKIRGLFK